MTVTHYAVSPMLHLVDGIVQYLFASNNYKTAGHLHHPHDNWYQVLLAVCSYIAFGLVTFEFTFNTEDTMKTL